MKIKQKESKRSVIIKGTRRVAEPQKPIIEVMYRTDFEGGFAYMPYEIATHNGCGTGYFERGYHSSVSHDYVLTRSKPGASDEFKKHFEAFYGDEYQIKEIRKRSHEKWVEAYEEVYRK